MSFAKVNLTVIDQTTQPVTAPIGVSAVALQTQKGRIGVPVFCRSWQEYREEFGEIIDPTDSIDPIYAKRLFDNGGQAYITRVVHFTDINDIDSYTPVEASGSNGGIFNFSRKIVGVDTVNLTLTIQGDYTDYIEFSQAHVVQKAAGGTTNLTTVAAGTVAEYSGGYTTIYYQALLVGDAVSGDALTWSVNLLASLAYEASSPGTWGNIISVEIKRAASGLANAVDVFARSTDASVLGTDLNEVYRNFSTTPTAGQIQAFNDFMKLIQIPTGGVISPPIGVVPPNLLTGGTDDYASVIPSDYLGSTVANNGIRAFDSESGFVRIACPGIANNIVDTGLLDYAILRKDCVAILRTPESLFADGAIDYRNATGAYSGGTKIDNWRATMLFGGLEITSPYPADNGSILTISWIGDFLGLSSAKDKNFGAWFSVSNTTRGTITNARDIVYNINTPSRAQEAEDLTAAGLFPIIKDKINGVETIVSWGDRTLQVSASAFQFANVGDLVIYINNGINPLTKKQLFIPNDILTWKSIYKDVAIFMQNLQNRRGISSWDYEGDQDVDNVSQAVINTPLTISQGIYKFNLFFNAITSLGEVRGQLIATATANGITLGLAA